MTTPNRLPRRPLRERIPLLRVPLWTELAVVAIGLGLSTSLRIALAAALGAGFPFITFLPVLVGVTFLLGPRAGLLFAALGSVIAWYLFLPPFQSFALSTTAAVALAFNIFTNGAIVGLFYWMQRANAELVVERETSARLAATRELLFRELQHRVSNNLQMVAALLTVQRRKIADPEAKLALDEASRRLGVIGRISRQLYDPTGAGKDLPAFLDQLARDVIETSGHANITHHVSGVSPSGLEPEAAIPLALVVAEAIANSIEHGFANREDACRVDIRVRSTADHRLQVEVEDDGCGLPSGFTLEQSESLGLKIATMLASQLGGKFTLQPGISGTLARLELPLAAT